MANNLTTITTTQHKSNNINLKNVNFNENNLDCLFKFTKHSTAESKNELVLDHIQRKFNHIRDLDENKAKSNLNINRFPIYLILNEDDFRLLFEYLPIN